MISRITKKKIIKKKQTIKNNNCQLLPINKINHIQIEQLLQITNDKNIMKSIGKGNIWDKKYIEEIIKDEENQYKKLHCYKKYYSFILICNNKVIGYISGRKNRNILPKKSSPYDLLLRMFIGSQYIGKGYGKLILKLFIQKYTNIINNMNLKDKNIKLISDIDETNLPSIKIHLANEFKYIDTIKYPNKKFYERYVLEL